MNIIAKHIVKKAQDRQRFQEYGVGIFVSVSTKSALKKAIKRKEILINQQPATTAYFVQEGDIIELIEPAPQQQKPFKFPLKILYEDDYLAIVLKPCGISVSGNKWATIANALPQNLKWSSAVDATHPHPVHRLDYPTSGVLVIGKTLSIRQQLHKMFAEQEVSKTYHAVCVNEFKQRQGIINLTLDDKEAFTQYKVIQSVLSEKFKALSLVQLNPKTGRTHQLRRHLLHIHNPIMGDKKYFLPEFQHKGYGLYLHATSIELKHPLTNQILNVKSELPKKFKRIFNL